MGKNPRWAFSGDMRILSKKEASDLFGSYVAKASSTAAGRGILSALSKYASWGESAGNMYQKGTLKIIQIKKAVKKRENIFPSRNKKIIKNIGIKSER